MADYTCPNCGTYSGPHDVNCVSGGLAAQGRLKMYTILNRKLDKLWIEHRLYGTQITRSQLQDLIDESWQEAWGK